MENPVYNHAFSQAIKIIDFSLKCIRKWEYDIDILEELLRINHRGWELLLKTFRLCFNGQFIPGHNLKNQIEKIKEDNLFWVEIQNLEELFFSEKSQDYFQLLDDLFDVLESRYAHINDLIGQQSIHYKVDSWIKKYKLDHNDQEMYEKIKETIVEINLINMRYIALHFSQNRDGKLKVFYSLFPQEVRSYMNAKFN